MPNLRSKTNLNSITTETLVVITLISTGQASEELNYTTTWPSRQVLYSHTHAISHAVHFLHKVSSQLELGSMPVNIIILIMV